jgi:hypothetical protein
MSTPTQPLVFCPIHGDWFDVMPDDEDGVEPGLFLACGDPVPVDEHTEAPDTCLNRVDGHWYVVTYGRAPYQIHAADCPTCKTRCEYDSGSMPGNRPLCDRPADVRVAYSNGSYSLTVDVCKQHLASTEARVYPSRAEVTELH